MSGKTMNSASTKSRNPGQPEAESFTRIEFHHELAPGGTVSIHTADCGIDTPVSNLKEDLNPLLGPATTQMWYLRNKIMEDVKCLRYYGFTGTEHESRPAKILVKALSK